MIWFCLFFSIYLAGFVVWYRNRYRTYLNTRDRRIAYNKTVDYRLTHTVNSINECKAGSLMMAIFWPLTIIPWLLSAGVKTDQQIKKAQEAKEKKQAEFKAKAKELNLPGWEHL